MTNLIMTGEDISEEKKQKKLSEERNLKFYKLLGQNHEMLINGILRGKDIYYKIPKEYQLSTKKPLILDWLLEYSRPTEISQVRSFGPVRLLCIYNALMAWIEQHPEDTDKWIYMQEWEEFFKSNPKAFKKPKQSPKKVEEPKPIDVVIPKMDFFTKQGNFRVTTGLGDVFISSSIKKGNKTNYTKVLFHFRKSTHHKFDSEYLIFAIYQNRIYFKESHIKEGFKITNKNNTSGVFSVTVAEKDLVKFEPFLKKELFLKYDEIYKMHYVEIEEDE